MLLPNVCHCVSRATLRFTHSSFTPSSSVRNPDMTRETCGNSQTRSLVNCLCQSLQNITPPSVLIVEESQRSVLQWKCPTLPDLLTSLSPAISTQVLGVGSAFALVPNPKCCFFCFLFANQQPTQGQNRCQNVSWLHNRIGLEQGRLTCNKKSFPTLSHPGQRHGSSAAGWTRSRE